MIFGKKRKRILENLANDKIKKIVNCRKSMSQRYGLVHKVDSVHNMYTVIKMQTFI